MEAEGENGVDLKWHAKEPKYWMTFVCTCVYAYHLMRCSPFICLLLPLPT